MLKQIVVALFFFTLCVSAQAQTSWVVADGSSYQFNPGWIGDYFSLKEVVKVEVNGTGTNWVWQEMTLQGDMYTYACSKGYSLKKNEYCIRVTTTSEVQCFPEYVRVYNEDHPQNLDPRLLPGSYKMNEAKNGSNFTSSIIF